MEKQRQKKRKRQLQKIKQRRRRSLHAKHKRRRKKDCMIGMPLIIGFQGDPAMGYWFRCNEVVHYQSGEHTYHLINSRYTYPYAFKRLHQYLNRRILHITKQGCILVKDAPKL